MEGLVPALRLDSTVETSAVGPLTKTGCEHPMTSTEENDVSNEHTEPTVTDRGFKRMPEIPSALGGHIRVYESSAAMGPHIWVRTEQPSDLNDRNSEPLQAVAHLPLEAAEQLRDQLTALIDNHYQND